MPLVHTGDFDHFNIPNTPGVALKPDTHATNRFLTFLKKYVIYLRKISIFTLPHKISKKHYLSAYIFYNIFFNKYCNFMVILVTKEWYL